MVAKLDWELIKEASLCPKLYYALISYAYNETFIETSLEPFRRQNGLFLIREKSRDCSWQGIFVFLPSLLSQFSIKVCRFAVKYQSYLVVVIFCVRFGIKLLRIKYLFDFFNLRLSLFCRRLLHGHALGQLTLGFKVVLFQALL